jgi:hypothetical protein
MKSTIGGSNPATASDLAVAALPASVPPMPVMSELAAVQTDADSYAPPITDPEELFIDQHTVGLKPETHLYVRFQRGSGRPRKVLEILFPGQQRFAAMEHDIHRR